MNFEINKGTAENLRYKQKSEKTTIDLSENCWRTQRTALKKWARNENCNCNKELRKERNYFYHLNAGNYQQKNIATYSNIQANPSQYEIFFLTILPIYITVFCDSIFIKLSSIETFTIYTHLFNWFVCERPSLSTHGKCVQATVWFCCCCCCCAVYTWT